MEMSKTYNPSEFEKNIYEDWERGGCFRAEADKSKKPFTIMMPPPNITGQLHMGHALDQTVQDALTRFKRMQGYSALWLPGTDHASIATEVKIVKKMKDEEGLSKEDVGREGFLERAWEWKKQYGGRIVEQLKRLGSSCDWSRLAFTMDERCSRAVKEVFVNLYEKGLIYQGSRIINWCPECKTALSDAEVDYSEDASFFWHLKYKFKDSDDYIVVATTRPETMLGDTAVAVNPEDDRYRELIGKTLILPLVNREIPVIADSYVDKEFGSGAVKITPAHDPNDFEVGLRHNLEVIRVMNDDGTMNDLAGEYKGLDRMEARKRIVEDLDKLGLLLKIEPHIHNVGHCYRCSCTVEPIISKQWFVKMEPLAKPAIDVVKNKELNFIPDRFSKIYYNWMENIKDWCISRQLWWGHRIPAYYCQDCGKMTVSKDDVTACPECGSKNIRQDEDVLDTWFSSALWPFSTLGYPEKTEDLQYFYPTDVLVTAYDIIFFWVARMIFSGIEHMGEIPFKEVLIHGIVRDAEGRKMSKSLGNGIDPLEIIDKYGADSLRFSLLNGISAGADTRFSEKKLEGCRNFMNKLWNASRFVLMNADGKEIPELKDCALSAADKWILTKLQGVIAEVTADMEKYELGLACSAMYDFVWSDFCDWYIELTKTALYGDDEKKRLDSLGVLVYVLRDILKLMHPFTPFITEQIYRNLPGTKGTIMLTEYPAENGALVFDREKEIMESVMEIIRSVRDIKSQAGAPPSKRVELFVKTDSRDDVKGAEDYIIKLAGVSAIKFVGDKAEIEVRTASKITSACELYIPMGSLIDEEKERARLGSELEKIDAEIDRAKGKLANPGFTDKAPEKLVAAEREKLSRYEQMREKILLSLSELGK